MHSSYFFICVLMNILFWLRITNIIHEYRYHTYLLVMCTIDITMFDWMSFGIHLSQANPRSSRQPYTRGASDSRFVPVGHHRWWISPLYLRFKPGLPNWKDSQACSDFDLHKSQYCPTASKRYYGCFVNSNRTPPTESDVLHKLIKCPLTRRDPHLICLSLKTKSEQI